MPVLERPAFGRAPAIGALVVLDDQFLGLAVVGDVRPPIAVQVGDHQRGNPFFRGNAFDAETGVGRQFIDFAPDIFGGGAGKIGFAGLIVEEHDLRPGVVHHDQVGKAIPVEVRRVQFRDEGIDRIGFRTSETEIIFVGVHRRSRREANAQGADDREDQTERAHFQAGGKCHRAPALASLFPDHVRAHPAPVRLAAVFPKINALPDAEGGASARNRDA